MNGFRNALSALIAVLAIGACDSGTSPATDLSSDALEVKPAALTFGDVTVGRTVSQEVTIVNPGAGSATVTELRTEGEGLAVSGLELPATLAPGESRTFEVAFTAGQEAQVSGGVALVIDTEPLPVVIPAEATVVADTSGDEPAPDDADEELPPLDTPTVPAPDDAVTVPTVVPSFPGAMGAGALSKGGRGGRVIEVTNLNDTGTGSLRACVQATGARTCVFRVAGTINLATPLQVRNPYLTVAGQTAPGGGIQISGKNTNGVITIYAHNVIWQYTRLRKGYNAAVGTQNGSCASVRDPAYNVMLDHNSIFWTQDDQVVGWYPSTSTAAKQKDITFSWNLVAEPLSNHPILILTGANERADADGITNIDFHHNLLANFSHRGPLLKHKSSNWVNNIVYNWKLYASQVGGGIQMDFVNNVYKRGPLTPSTGTRTHEIQVWPTDITSNLTHANGSPSIYVAGNIGPNNRDPAADNWASMVRKVSGENDAETGSLSTSYRRTTRRTATGVFITAEPAATLEASLLPRVGAYRRLDCYGKWVAMRDTADARVVAEYKAGTGKIPATEADVGGFPKIASGIACADSDKDGMPDSFETARGLNPRDAADGVRVQANGFTNLEHYLHGI